MKSQEMMSKVKYRLFIGCIISAELRLQLSQSIRWKQAKIVASTQEDLEETHYHEKDYIGRFLDYSPINLNDLRLTEAKVMQAIKNYCPEYACEKIKIVVFSQVFVS